MRCIDREVDVSNRHASGARGHKCLKCHNRSGPSPANFRQLTSIRLMYTGDLVAFRNAFRGRFINFGRSCVYDCLLE